MSPRFANAVQTANALPGQGNETKLKLYGLFKQATVGLAPEKGPSAFEVVKRAKWQAWRDQYHLTQKKRRKTDIDVLINNCKLTLKRNVYGLVLIKANFG